MGCCLPRDFDPDSPELIHHPSDLVKRDYTTTTIYYTSYTTIHEVDTVSVVVTEPAVTTSTVHVTMTDTVSAAHTIFVTATSTEVATSTVFETLRFLFPLPTSTPPPLQSYRKKDPIW